MEDKKFDEVAHPKHYNQGSIQSWDFIHVNGLGFIEGNIIKYVVRHRHKHGLKDLLKAKAYLEKLIKLTEDPSHRGDAL